MHATHTNAKETTMNASRIQNGYQHLTFNELLDVLPMLNQTELASFEAMYSAEYDEAVASDDWRWADEAQAKLIAIYPFLA